MAVVTAVAQIVAILKKLYKSELLRYEIIYLLEYCKHLEADITVTENII